MEHNKPYKAWLQAQLKLTKVKVHRWLPWCPEGDQGYQAFISTRRVNIPIPECDWSFLVGLHEIGHVSTGERLYSHLMEYNAERWAIKRAKQSYGIECPEYVVDAKEYVKFHLLQDIACTDFSIDKVKPYVLDWLELDKNMLLEELYSAEFSYN